MGSIIEKIAGLKCVDASGNINHVEPIACYTKSGMGINPWWILTGDILIVVILGILIIGGVIWIKKKLN